MSPPAALGRYIALIKHLETCTGHIHKHSFETTMELASDCLVLSAEIHHIAKYGTDNDKNLTLNGVDIVVDRPKIRASLEEAVNPPEGKQGPAYIGLILALGKQVGDLSGIIGNICDQSDPMPPDVAAPVSQTPPPTQPAPPFIH